MLFWIMLIPAALAAGVNGECPLPAHIFPCTCNFTTDKFGDDFSILTCHDIHAEETLRRVMDATRGFKLFELQLVDSTLRYIPHDLFVDTTFELLNIENSSISALSETDIAFEGLDDHLRMLEVVNCSFTANWDWVQLSHLEHLKEVVVTDSELLDITRGLATIRHLDLKAFVFTGNKIQYLENHVFAPFDAMSRLTLDHNDIEVVQRSMFPRPANNLEVLGLSYNKLTSLPNDIFRDMPALTSLFLTGNQLQTIDEVVFSPVWNQIHNFFFHDSPLSCDCRLSWIKQTDLSRKFIHAECRGPTHVKGRPVSSLEMHELWCD